MYIYCLIIYSLFFSIPLSLSSLELIKYFHYSIWSPQLDFWLQLLLLLLASLASRDCNIVICLLGLFRLVRVNIVPLWVKLYNSNIPFTFPHSLCYYCLNFYIHTCNKPHIHFSFKQRKWEEIKVTYYIYLHIFNFQCSLFLPVNLSFHIMSFPF